MKRKQNKTRKNKRGGSNSNSDSCSELTLVKGSVETSTDSVTFITKNTGESECYYAPKIKNLFTGQESDVLRFYQVKGEYVWFFTNLNPDQDYMLTMYYYNDRLQDIDPEPALVFEFKTQPILHPYPAPAPVVSAPGSKKNKKQKKRNSA